MQHKNEAGAGQDISVIALGARVVGDVHTTGVVQVAGSVFGNIRAERTVLVAKGGMVEGDIESPEAVIGGEVRGRVRATHRVAVQASAALHGTISTPRLAVQEGATLDVELCMREPAAPLDLSDRHSDIRKLPADVIAGAAREEVYWRYEDRSGTNHSPPGPLTPKAVL